MSDLTRNNVCDRRNEREKTYSFAHRLDERNRIVHVCRPQHLDIMVLVVRVQRGVGRSPRPEHNHLIPTTSLRAVGVGGGWAVVGVVVGGGGRVETKSGTTPVQCKGEWWCEPQPGRRRAWRGSTDTIEHPHSVAKWETFAGGEEANAV